MNEHEKQQASLLEISRELAAIAQAGLTYTENHFDRDRFARLRVLASAVLEADGVPDFYWPDDLGYPTPKVDVRGAIFEGDRVLLIKEVATGRYRAAGPT